MNWLRDTELVRRLAPNIASDKLKIKDQITFFTSIYNFLKNGFTLDEAIKFYTVVHPGLKTQVEMIKRNLRSGHSFAKSVRSLVNFRTFCQLKIAEFHGNLLSALDNISRFLRLKRKQRSRLTGLLIYPAFLLILLTGIFIGIRVLVTPQLQTFKGPRGQNNDLYIIIAIIPVALIIYGLWRYCRDRSKVWQINLLLRIPLIGSVYKYYYAYYVASNLALMMKCGLDLKQIVTFMQSFKTSSLIQSLSVDIKSAVNRGTPLSYLRRRYRFLPKEMLVLLDTGDTTDVLAQKLKAYSKVEFRLMMKKSSRLITMIQPVMFLIIGLLITGTYLSMLLPMYQSIKGVY